MTIELPEANIPSRYPVEQSGETDLGDYGLVERVRQGDLAAFEFLMRRNNRRLYRAALGVVGNPGEIEDAIRDTYLRAYASHLDFRGPHGFASWITRIAVNEALGRVQKRGRVFASSGISANCFDRNERSMEEVHAPEPASERLAANAERRPNGGRHWFRGRSRQSPFHRVERQLRWPRGGDTRELMPSVHEFAGSRCDRVVPTGLRRPGAPPGESWPPYSFRAIQSTVHPT